MLCDVEDVEHQGSIADGLLGADASDVDSTTGGVVAGRCPANSFICRPLSLMLLLSFLFPSTVVRLLSSYSTLVVHSITGQQLDNNWTTTGQQADNSWQITLRKLALPLLTKDR